MTPEQQIAALRRWPRVLAQAGHRAPERHDAGAMSILCWFCPVCTTMTLLERVERGECIQEPRRGDCPLHWLERIPDSPTARWLAKIETALWTPDPR